MIEQFKTRQFILFLLTGGFAAAINFFSRIVYNWYFSFSIAVVLAYFNGMIVAFTLAKIFVFHNSQNSLSKSTFAFVVINIFAVLQTLLLSLLLANFVLPAFNWSFYKNEIAHAVGVVFPVFTSYIGHKYYTFK